MRLRYLYLPDLPPLSQVRIEFGRGAPLLIERACAIRFVVGVNGTGKSRLMQALAEIMLTLEAPRLPGFNFALAYDLGENEAARTIFIRHLDNSAAQATLFEFSGLVDEQADWRSLERLRWDSEKRTAIGSIPVVVRKDESTRDLMRVESGREVRNGFSGDALPAMKRNYLPNILLAYTSGDLRGWETLFRAASRTESIESTPQRERPRGWDRADEEAEQRRIRNEEVIAALRRGEIEVAQRLLGDGTPPQDQREGQSETLGVLVTPRKLKLAVCAVALWQAQLDFNQIQDEASEDSFIENIEQQPSELRRILNQVDWLWPVSISLRVDLHPERLTDRRRFILRRLYTKETQQSPIVTTVVRDPEGREGRLLVYDLRRSLPQYSSSTATALIEAIAERPAATAFEIFSQLVQWHGEGLLEDVFLSVRKRHTTDLLLYDWLSDGERVFLGRMALFHLLQGMGDALVLLDEPETHFNDVWKREIVSLIDAAIGDEPSDVVISTHSSITLSDVASKEVIRLRRDDGDSVLDPIQEGVQTFGAGPGELMTKVFGARASIGQYSREQLNDFLRRPWTVDNIEELEQLIRHIGPGYHRSELRLRWREIRDSQG